MKNQIEYFKSKGIHISISGLPKMVLQSISFSQDVSEEDFSLLKFFMAKCIVKENKPDINLLDISDSFEEYMKLKLLYYYSYKKECKKVKEKYYLNHYNYQLKLKSWNNYLRCSKLKRPFDYKIDFIQVDEISKLQSFIKIDLFNLKAKLKHIPKIKFNFYNQKHKLIKNSIIYLDKFDYSRFSDIMW